MSFFTEPRQKKLFEDVKKYYNTHKFDYLHQFDHTVRVLWWIKFLSLKEKADLSITIPAAILHDIAIPTVGDEKHARAGAKLCKPFLKKCDYSKDEIERIAETISMHSQDDPKPPKTIEAKVMFDADKLDAVGPIALHRWFFDYAKEGYKNHEAVKKTIEHINKWKKIYGNPPFFTKTAKKISVKGLRYIEKICNEILKDSKKFKEIYKEADLSD